MNRAQTRVRGHAEAIRWTSKFRTAVSLHSHTHHSKESLDFLPHLFQTYRIPILSWLFQSSLDRYEGAHGKSVDFTRAYWTPPVSPELVLASERAQIEDQFGLASLVSITDHDTIAAPLSLREKAEPAMPLSLEWTVPFAGNSFHVGVHHLPSDLSSGIVKGLASYTAKPAEDKLPELLALLNSFPETLVVLNHPYANFIWVEADEHRRTLREFMKVCRPWIHGLEFNGIRAWKENRETLHLAEEYDLPVIAGGDRHDRRPNTVLNLTHAESWDEFVDEIRCKRRNNILLTKAYEEPVESRKLASAGDVLRRYEHYPEGRRRFADRMFVSIDDRSWHSLAYHWDRTAPPKWVKPAVAATIVMASDSVRPILSQFLFPRWKSGMPNPCEIAVGRAPEQPSAPMAGPALNPEENAGKAHVTSSEESSFSGKSMTASEGENT